MDAQAAQALLSDLHSRGITLIADGEKLTVQPASRLTDADRAAIRQSRPDLLRILTETHPTPTSPVAVVLDLDAIADAVGISSPPTSCLMICRQD